MTEDDLTPTPSRRSQTSNNKQSHLAAEALQGINQILTFGKKKLNYKFRLNLIFYLFFSDGMLNRCKCCVRGLLTDWTGHSIIINVLASHTL